MDNITMIALPGNDVSGSLNVNRLGNLFSSDTEGWEAVTVHATEESTDAVWHIEVSEIGTFSTILPEGNWSFTTNLEWLNSSTASLEVNDTNDFVEIYLYPENSYIEIDFFLDHQGNNNADNGTPVNYEFSISLFITLSDSVCIFIDFLESGPILYCLNGHSLVAYQFIPLFILRFTLISSSYLHFLHV